MPVLAQYFLSAFGCLVVAACATSKVEEFPSAVEPSADIERMEPQRGVLDDAQADDDREGDALQAESDNLDAVDVSEMDATEMVSEQEFDQKMAAAKAAFKPEEADVFRDGDRLIIRLKKMAFPPGKSTLSKESLGLLAKVRDQVSILGPSSITIEGHTDSTGSRTTNQQLSEERAFAIEEYLRTQGAGDTEITAMGFADSNPIATNSTEAGRSQNRRVDIILEPTKVAH